MTTISKNTTLTIDLSSPAYSNPVTIDAGVTIAGSGGAGVSATSGYWNIQNSGTVSGSSTVGFSYGVRLGGSDTVFNATSALIAGYVGIFMGISGTVVNYGTIMSADAGIVMREGAISGSITNAASGSIIANDPNAQYSNGILAADVSVTVVNMGIINGGAGMGAGVLLAHGGWLTNAASGTITGFDGVYLTYGGAMVNDGSIAGIIRDGLYLNFVTGLSVTNAASASIGGRIDGIYFFGGDGTVVNYGSIAGTLGDGVDLSAIGSVSNAASGSITGGTGVAITSTAGTVVNKGHITGTSGNGAGVVLLAGGSVTNATAASIIGNLGGGVQLSAGATLTNAGTIIGNDGTAVAFGGTAGDRLILDPGAVFSGLVIGSDSASNTLELAAGSGTGTLSGLGSRFINFGSLTVDSGSTWDFTGSSTIAAGVTLTDKGTLTGTLTNASVIDGPLTLGNGAVLTNAAGGVITNGKTAAIYSEGGVVTVVNDGSIAGTGSLTILSDALDLNPDASVTNAATASITGVKTGVYIAGLGTVVNDGRIAGTRNYGINLGAGSFVTNASSATIIGGRFGVFTEGASPATVVNSGSIGGTGSTSSGVDLGSGGWVTNAASASITGYRGVSINGAGTLVNAGAIAGTAGNGDGVMLHFGGSVSNAASGSITGYDGVDVSHAAAAVVNAGSIAGTGNYAYALDLFAGGSVSNAISASITGGTGVEITGSAGTVVNDGGIAGTHGDGVNLGPGGLVSNAVSASIIGKYHGVSISGAGTVVNDGSIGATAGNGVGVGLYGGGTLTNAGTIGGSGGTAVYLGGTGSDRLVVQPGAVFSGAVYGGASASNTLELASASGPGTLNGLGGSFTNFGSIVFDPGADWFIAGSTTGLDGTISGFALGDTIELSGVTASSPNFAAGVLTLTESGGGTVTLDLPGTFTGLHFVANTVAAGTDVSLACFAKGTRIATERGMRAVEALRKGDRVRTLPDGKLRPIVWLGHRRVDCRRHPDPAEVWPIRIGAGAFGPGLPYRDLSLSPDHAVFINGVLIPIRYLVNGRTIVQQAYNAITYWHVELAEHAVLCAEGLPAESYLDTGNRSAFANGGPVMDLHANFARRVWKTRACAELVLDGPRIATAKRNLLARASTLGHRTTDDAGLNVLADGRKLAVERHGLVWRMHLPKAATHVRLVSRVWNPAHMQPGAEDTRSLGVAVSRLWLDGRAIELDGAQLRQGWHARERTWRWTDGDAWLAANGARALAFEMVLTGSYWLEQHRKEAHAA